MGQSANHWPDELIHWPPRADIQRSAESHWMESHATVRYDAREARTRFESLTPRQREVFSLVVQGKLNRQIAAALGTAERTVKAHRAAVMKKMQVDSLVALIRLAERLGM